VRNEDPIAILKDAFPDIKIIPTTETDIKSIIHSLKSKNSSGYDDRTCKILKTSDLIGCPLTHICNHSLRTGIFSDRLKISVVKPLYKKGCKTSMTNYRPISLLTIFF
jgi:hypothetical protein